MEAVGVIANPASGRDVRRLVSGASVFDNSEKGSMVHRLMTGLGAAGVERVLMMPAGDGVLESLRRRLGALAEATRAALPDLEVIDMRLVGTAEDSVRAVESMVGRGVAAIAVLGGDGTHRVVAEACGDTPLCCLSTGTNNAFSEIREATVAGIATGLVATGHVDPGVALRRAKRLAVLLPGRGVVEHALVDVAVSRERWIGARALWRFGSVSELCVAFAEPNAVGLSAIAGLLEPVPRAAHHGLYVRLGDPAHSRTALSVPVAPGLVGTVGVVETRRLEPGRPLHVAPGVGSLALDGEREIELRADDQVEVRLDLRGPLTIDVDAVMTEAARRGLLRASDPAQEVSE